MSLPLLCSCPLHISAWTSDGLSNLIHREARTSFHPPQSCYVPSAANYSQHPGSYSYVLLSLPSTPSAGHPKLSSNSFSHHQHCHHSSDTISPPCDSFPTCLPAASVSCLTPTPSLCRAKYGLKTQTNPINLLAFPGSLVLSEEDPRSATLVTKACVAWPSPAPHTFLGACPRICRDRAFVTVLGSCFPSGLCSWLCPLPGKALWLELHQPGFFSSCGLSMEATSSERHRRPTPRPARHQVCPNAMRFPDTAVHSFVSWLVG